MSDSDSQQILMIASGIPTPPLSPPLKGYFIRRYTRNKVFEFGGGKAKCLPPVNSDSMYPWKMNRPVPPAGTNPPYI